MAFDYCYESEPHLIVLTGSGTVTMAERAECVRWLLEDPALPREAAILIDVCRVENPPLNNEIAVVGMLVKQLQVRFGSLVAILNTTVGHVTLSHLIAFSAGAEEDKVRAFVSAGEARAWLAEAGARSVGKPPMLRSSPAERERKR